MATAVGADARIGFIVDEPSDNYNVGKPGFDPVSVAAPVAALTPAAGGAGNLSGTFYWAYSYVVNGLESTPSAASAGQALTTQIGSLTDVLVCPDTRCTERRIYQGTTATVANMLWCGSVYDNSTTTFSANIAQASLDSTKKPKTTNETAGNWGLKFFRFDSSSLEAKYQGITPAELTGNLGKSKSVPGSISVEGQMVSALRSGSAVGLFTALLGKPTESQSSSVYTYTWAASVAKLSPRTLTGYLYKGASTITPETFYGLCVPTLALNVAGGALVTDTATIIGQHHTLTGVATVHAGGSTYTGALVARGIRDTSVSTDDLYVKVSTAPTGGTFALKFTMGGSGTYTGSAVTCYYDTSSKKQEKGGSQESDWVEASKDDGTRLGFDTGENRLPYEILFTGDVTGLQLNDEFIIPVTPLIPGGSGSGYTQVPPHVLIGPRFTAAHAYLTKDAVAVEAQSATLNLATPKERIYSLGSEARSCIDIVDNGYYTAGGTIVRRLDNRTYDTALQTNDRFQLVFKFEGEGILTDPATRSANRETVQLTFPQCAVLSTASPISGPGMVSETVTWEAESPDDSSEFVTVVVKTAERWGFKS